MFFLLFFISILQFFTFWLFEPLTKFITLILEIRIFPIIALLLAIFIFSSEGNK